MIRHLIFKGVVLSMALLTFGSVASGTEDPIRKHSSHYKAFLLADAQTGRILDTDRPQRLIYPASLVKMMVALIVLEEVDSGKRRLREKVLVSRSASKIGGSQVYLREGEVFELLELMKAMVISSANDAAVAVAEHVSGSRAKFMKRMNRRAWELGMQRTRFHSPHGLPVRRGQQPDVTTAYDLYLLALELLKHPQYLKWSSTRLDTFRNGTFQLTNTNHRLIRNYPGMDGMKTGYIRASGFNLDTQECCLVGLIERLNSGDRLSPINLSVQQHVGIRNVTVDDSEIGLTGCRESQLGLPDLDQFTLPHEYVDAGGVCIELMDCPGHRSIVLDQGVLQAVGVLELASG